MKDLLMAMALLALTTSCSKDKPNEHVDPILVDTPIIALGKVSMLKNGDPWNASSYAKYYPGDFGRFFISGKGFNNSLDEDFSFTDIPIKKGNHSIERRNLWNHNNYIPDLGLLDFRFFSQTYKVFKTL